ncbi:MAG: DUF302 domain-containing protein [Pseudomonadota bacterium]
MTAKTYHKTATVAASALLLLAPATAASDSQQPSSENALSKIDIIDGPRLISKESTRNFEDTLSRLQAAVTEKGFRTFAVIDHAAGAASIGETLRPTTLIIFGNPKGGTPLLQAEQKLGAALPLKALIYETADGRVIVATTDIKAVLSAHGVDDAERAEKIAGVLAALLTAATD